MAALGWLLNLDFAGGTAVVEPLVPSVTEVPLAFRIPHPDSPVELRQAIQRLKYRFFDESSDVDHDATTNFIQDEHIAHSGVSITTAANSGLAGGGTIASTRTLVLDVNNLAEVGIDSGDFIPFWDLTATAGTRKITFLNFEAALNHDSLAGFVTKEHIDWTNAGDNLKTSGTGEFANVGIGAAADVHTLYVYGSPVYPAALGSTCGINAIFEPSWSENCNIANYAMSFIATISAESGKANVGKCAAVLGSIIGGADFDGSLTRSIGLQVQYGINGGGGTITYQYGLYLQAYHASGTIANSYDIIIGAPVTGGAVTNSWSIYGLSPDDSYLAGPIGLGVDAPDARLEIQTGATEGRQAVTIDQNDEDQVFIDFQGASEASAAKSISTWTAGNSIQGFVWVEINGAKKRMPYYDEPTS